MASDPIRADEELYRRLRYEHVKGQAVLFNGITMPAASVNRQKYSRPADVIVPHSPEHNGIGVTTPAEISTGFSSTQTNKTYRFIAEYVPSKNKAHSEIRMHLTGEVFIPKWKVDRADVEVAKMTLAFCFRIHTAPTDTATNGHV